MKKTYLICGKFFDGVHEELQENVRLLIEGKTIVAVGKDLPQPDDAEVIDLSRLTITPGLIDAHVHLEFMDFTVNEFAITDSDEAKTLNLVHNCMVALQSGFTTLRTLGTAFQGFGCIDVKRAIDKGMFPAARLLVAPHALGIPGGHWDFSTFYGGSNPHVAEFMEQSNSTGNGADDFKRLVRKQVKYGADIIKIMATGGFASPNDDPGISQLDDDELKAIIETANSLGKRVAAHAYTSDVIDKMINMGLHEVEHGTMIQPHTADLMAEKNVYLVPTIYSLLGDPKADPDSMPPKSPAYQRKLKKYANQLAESRKTIVKLIMDHKVVVGYGSDIVASKLNTDSWCEFQAWRNIGIPALRTLVAATSDNAKIIGREDLGELCPGKLADISGWSSDLINDFDALRDCSFVMKEGTIYKK